MGGVYVLIYGRSVCSVMSVDASIKHSSTVTLHLLYETESPPIPFSVPIQLGLLASDHGDPPASTSPAQITASLL